MPILFKREMVKAILEKRKNVTRRIVKPQPPDYVDWLEYKSGSNSFRGYMQPGEPTVHYTKAKYRPGLKLWVRETFTLPDKLIDGILYRHLKYLYAADYDNWDKMGKWNSPLFIPRAASRISLKIVDVKIERLHELDEIDAILEGCKSREDFVKLWNSINKDHPWAANPWVYRIQFERIEL